MNDENERRLHMSALFIYYLFHAADATVMSTTEYRMLRVTRSAGTCARWMLYLHTGIFFKKQTSHMGKQSGEKKRWMCNRSHAPKTHLNRVTTIIRFSSNSTAVTANQRVVRKGVGAARGVPRLKRAPS